MIPILRRIAIFAAFTLAFVYCLVALRGPQGVQALMDKHKQIRAMQEENARLSRENERLRQRNSDLRNSQEAQEREIREKLGRVRKGDESFVIPGKPVSDAVPASDSELEKREATAEP
jgi:cell division protein FtsB